MSAPTVLFVNTRPSPVEAEPCYRAAHRLGLEVVLLADAPVAVPPGSYQEHVAVDTYRNDQLVEAAERVAAERKVVGVVCWGDRDVEGTAHAAEALGLPGHSPAAAATARNKGSLRECLSRRAPDLTVGHRHLRSPEDADLPVAIEAVGFPAILKPAGASSSKGIFRVADEGELRDALALLRAYTRAEVDPIFGASEGEMVLEEYVDGSEHSVEGLVRDGELVAAAVTDKWVEPAHFLEYRQLHPSALPPEGQEVLIDAARRTAEAVGLGTGAFHLELRLTTDGGVRVIELNARTGGGYITTHLIPISRGYEFLEATLQLNCDIGRPPRMPPASAVAGSHKLLADTAGRLRGLDGLDRALRRPGIVTLVPERAIGAEVLLPPDGYTESALLSLIALGYDQEDVAECLSAAAAAVVPDIGAE